MTRIATYELAARLPQLLARLAAGEEVLLTDAGRPVARVLPPIPPAPTAVDRLGAFEALTTLVQSRADRYPPGHVVDDDRESMYAEREVAPQ